jgi:hypothetical protein
MRHEWGMKQVLESCAEDSEADRMKVEELATMASRDFLQKMQIWHLTVRSFHFVNKWYFQ